jgi:hypothetical protein
MERLRDLLTGFLEVFLDAFKTVVSGAVSIVDWPASVIGIPPEILAAVILCLVLLALWRSLGGYFT